MEEFGAMLAEIDGEDDEKGMQISRSNSSVPNQTPDAAEQVAALTKFVKVMNDQYKRFSSGHVANLRDALPVISAVVARCLAASFLIRGALDELLSISRL